MSKRRRQFGMWAFNNTVARNMIRSIITVYWTTRILWVHFRWKKVDCVAATLMAWGMLAVVKKFGNFQTGIDIGWLRLLVYFWFCRPADVPAADAEVRNSVDVSSTLITYKYLNRVQC